MDEDVVNLAVEQNRVIVTQDLDFGRIYYFHHREQIGVLLLRLRGSSIAGIEARVREFLNRTDMGSKRLDRCLIVLEPHRYRVLR